MSKRKVLSIVGFLFFLIAGLFIFQKIKTTNIQKEGTPVVIDNYQNIKYEYSISYPSGYFIFQNLVGGSEPVAQEITDTADSVLIGLEKKSFDNFVFIINGTDETNFDPEYLKQSMDQFANANPDETDIVPAMVAGENGYKIKFNKVANKHDFYFVKNREGKVMEISVLLNNNVADQILSSLKFQ